MSFLADHLDRANALLVAHLGELGPLIAVGLLGVLLVLVALPAMLTRRIDPLDKLKEMRLNGDANSPDGVVGLRRGGEKDARLDRFAQYLEPQDLTQFSAIQLQLVRAGYRSRGAVQTLHFAQFALGIGGLLVGSILVLLGDGGSVQNSIMTVLGPGVAGYSAPKYWVKRRVQNRTDEIISGFPDSLDLMLVCVEAGQSLDQAIIRVAKEMRAGYPALSEEFEIVAYEMKAGKDKTQVLRDMGERVGIQDVSSFVTTLIQSATFGTSIAEALRVYAAEMRDKRVMRAEEKANKLPTKLTLGTMLFCLPPLLIILIGPSIYGISQNLAGG
jgi:tight adherence protein C